VDPDRPGLLIERF